MLNQIGAPAVEPLERQADAGPSGLGSRRRALVRELRALDRVDLDGPGGGGARHRRALGLRQVDAAGDRLRPARADRGLGAGRRSPRARASGCPAAPSCPSATCCCRGCRRSTTPRWRPASPEPRAPRAGARRGALRAPRPGRLRGSRPEELSGGMRQRVAFLRTLMAGRPVLLLDEPFASLDAITRAEAQAWLAGVLAADGHTVMLVTHDVEEALYLSDQVVVMSPRPGRVDRHPRRARPARRTGRPRSPRRSSPSCASGHCACWPGARREPAPALGARPAPLVVAGLLVAWELAARWDVLADALSIEPFLVPAPSEVAESLWEERSLLAEDAWVTLREVVLGFLLALVPGSAWRSSSTSPRPLGARSTRCWSHRRRSRSSCWRRCWWSGSGSGSCRSC